MRDILKDEKRALKANEVIHLDVPCYAEISVKNLYEDALADPDLTRYLPTKEQLSGKLPEKRFFFGVLGTLKRQYLTDIIKEAHAKRFKLPDDNPKKDAILIADTWMEELMKHPYYSSNFSLSHFL
jgi:hypothetical protein